MTCENVAMWRNTQELFRNYNPVTPAMKVKHTSVWNPIKSYAKTHVAVWKKDTLECALLLEKPLVLILADDVSPGGCVEAGAGMQEESLFRRSALHKHLVKNLYPILRDETIYAPDVPLTGAGTIDFIACPGIKMPKLSQNELFAEDVDVLESKIELILQVAYMNGHKHLVLGALGCGVWGCPTKHVALIFKRKIAEYDRVFQTIVFGILGANYNIFSEVFAE